MIKVTTALEAWEVAYKIADAGEYELDKDSRERAGYPIYRAKESYYSLICDLGCRLEVLKVDGSSTDVWIEPAAEEKEPAAQDAAKRGGGRALWPRSRQENPREYSLQEKPRRNSPAYRDCKRRGRPNRPSGREKSRFHPSEI